MDSNLIYWLWLTVVFGPANPRKWEAVARFDNAADCYLALSDGNEYGLTEEEIRAVRSVDLEKCEKIRAYCDKKGINLYGYDSVGYPQRLREIYNPPAVLFAYGGLEFIDAGISVGVVGARKPSDYSLKVCTNVCRDLARANITVISGFAHGIDTAAHTAAIENGGRTVAVLASGLEYDYPKGTSELKRKIAQSGAVISEYFPAHKPVYTDFKARNRILSGLSFGVAVIEASETSGALNTVSHALSQGRDIFCIPPHDIFDRRYLGMMDLLRDGAIPLFSGKDIVFEYHNSYSHRFHFARDVSDYSVRSEEVREFVSQLDIRDDDHEHPEPAQKSGPDTMPADLTAFQEKLWTAIAGCARMADELAAELETDISEILTELTELELSGLVVKLAGNRYALR